MDAQSLPTWFNRYVHRLRQRKKRAALGAVAMGVLFLFLTYVFSLTLTVFFLFAIASLSPYDFMTIAALVVLAFSFLYVVIPRRELERAEVMEEPAIGGRTVNRLSETERWVMQPRNTFAFRMWGGRGAWLYGMTNPDFGKSLFAQFIDLMTSGPRWIHEAIKFWRHARQLQAIDVRTCGAVVEFLYRRGKRASYEEIARAVPGVDPPTTFPQLALIDGVLHLVKEPPGFVLSEELREQLDKALRR